MVMYGATVIIYLFLIVWTLSKWSDVSLCRCVPMVYVPLLEYSIGTNAWYMEVPCLYLPSAGSLQLPSAGIIGVRPYSPPLSRNVPPITNACLLLQGHKDHGILLLAPSVKLLVFAPRTMLKATLPDACLPSIKSRRAVSFKCRAVCLPHS